MAVAVAAMALIVPVVVMVILGVETDRHMEAWVGVSLSQSEAWVGVSLNQFPRCSSIKSLISLIVLGLKVKRIEIRYWLRLRSNELCKT